MTPVPVQPAPATPPAETLEERFRRLAAQWHDAVAHHSASSIRYGHPAYQEIISLGPDVIPLLLRDLEENETHWFTALRLLTGARPIPPSAAGNVPKMVEAWLNWAKENGYRW